MIYQTRQRDSGVSNRCLSSIDNNSSSEMYDSTRKSREFIVVCVQVKELVIKTVAENY